jgi:pimeloyl-ACP methyl ester carboxylesterase
METPRRNFLKAAAAAGLVLPTLASNAAPALAKSSSKKRATSHGMGAPKYIDAGGIKTRYFEGGKGEPMVLVHGGQWPATTSADDWAPLFELLTPHYHVYAFDKLGMGYTDNPKTDADYSMDAVVRHTHDFLTAIGFKRGVLVGHSRGALPVARVACDHPELVSHLIILDSNALASDDIKLSERPDPPPLDKPPTREQMRAAALKSVLHYNKDYVTDAYVDEKYKITNLPKTKEADQKFRSLRDAWVKANPEKVKANPLIGNNMGSVVWWLIDCKHATMDMIRAGKLKAPTCMIWGWNDPFAPYSLGLSTMDTFAKVIDRTEINMVNHASHYVFVDQPKEVARLMLSFIQS